MSGPRGADVLSSAASHRRPRRVEVADRGLRSLAIIASVALIAACGLSPSPSSPAVASAGASTTPSVDAAFAGHLMMALETGLADVDGPGAQAAVVFADGSLWTGAAGISTADVPMK